MVSTRVKTAKAIAANDACRLNESQVVNLVFMIEACGYRVVKPEETLEYHGIPIPGGDDED